MPVYKKSLAKQGANNPATIRYIDPLFRKILNGTKRIATTQRNVALISELINVADMGFESFIPPLTETL
jgi:hypothetical protein